MVDKELMDKLGGERSEYDGAQDYDVILRATESTNPNNIKHISKSFIYINVTFNNFF